MSLLLLKRSTAKQMKVADLAHFMGSSNTFGESMARHCLHCFLAALGASAAAKTFSCAMALLTSKFMYPKCQQCTWNI